MRWQDHEFVLADIPGLIEGAAEGRGSRPPVPAPHRTGARARDPLRPRAGRRPLARRAGAGAARRVAPLPAGAARPAAPRRRQQGRRRAPECVRRAAHLGGDARRARRVPRPGRARWSTRRARPRASPSRTSCSARRSRVSRSSARARTRGACRAGPAERAVALADLTNPEAMAYVQQRLQRMGVEQALARAGARRRRRRAHRRRRARVRGARL